MKIAFVVQRYGDEVNGGAEAHCRQVAERLNRLYEVEVLTTCAIDYQTWKNAYAPGSSELGGITVRRFPVDFPRSPHTFANSYNFLVSYLLWLRNQTDIKLSDKAHVEKLLYPSSDDAAKIKLKHSFWQSLELSLLQRLNERFWMKMQGPYSSPLISYLKSNRRAYNAFFFFTYNYATTYYGLPLVKKHAALIPTVHEEACVAFSLYKKVFQCPRYILFNSPEERNFTIRKFPFIKQIENDIVGLGIDPPVIKRQNHILKLKHGIEDPFILYVGRIEPSKGFPLLFESFLHFKAQYSKPLKLLLLGKAEIPIPDHPDIISLGFVSEEVKATALHEAEVLVMPSFYESLSMVVLEAWLAKTPVLVNDHCRVLAAHCEKSQGGLCLHDPSSFANALHKILKDGDLQRSLALSGYRYVSSTYTWDKVIAKYRHIVEKIVH